MADLTYPKTLDEAREFIADGMMEPGGVDCPCCSQKVKLYSRHLNSGMARALIAIYHEEEHGKYFEVCKRLLANQSINAMALEFSKLKFWELIEKSPSEKGAVTAGNWRITDRGVAFVEGLLEVPRTAFVFNNKLMAYSEDVTDINKALADKFDYEELMEGTP